MKKKFRVAVIGAGAIGLDHIKNFQVHPSVEVVAVAETNIANAQTACEKFQIPEYVSDYRKLLARQDIDVISIALPNYLHAKVGLETLKAGKHLLLEKPMATNAKEAQALVKAAQQKKVLLMVGQNQRFNPESQTLKQVITKGKLGEIYHIDAIWSRRSGIPRIGSWFTQKQFAGGGCTYDIGVHILDLALYLTNSFDPVSVSGQTFSKLGPQGLGEGSWGKSAVDPRKPFDVEDYSIALIKLRGGRTILLRSSWAVHLPTELEQNITFFGTKASATLNPLALHRPATKGYLNEPIPLKKTKTNFNRMTHFIDCLLGKAAPLVKPEESLVVQKVLDAIYLSSSTGKEVSVK